MRNSVDKNAEEIVQLQKDLDGCQDREESFRRSGKEVGWSGDCMDGDCIGGKDLWTGDRF